MNLGWKQESHSWSLLFLYWGDKLVFFVEGDCSSESLILSSAWWRRQSLPQMTEFKTAWLCPYLDRLSWLNAETCGDQSEAISTASESVCMSSGMQGRSTGEGCCTNDRGSSWSSLSWFDWCDSFSQIIKDLYFFIRVKYQTNQCSFIKFILYYQWIKTTSHCLCLCFWGQSSVQNPV